MGAIDDAYMWRDVYSFNFSKLNDASGGCLLAKPKRCSSGNPNVNEDLIKINE